MPRRILTICISIGFLLMAGLVFYMVHNHKSLADFLPGGNTIAQACQIIPGDSQVSVTVTPPRSTQDPTVTFDPVVISKTIDSPSVTTQNQASLAASFQLHISSNDPVGTSSSSRTFSYTFQLPSNSWQHTVSDPSLTDKAQLMSTVVLLPGQAYALITLNLIPPVGTVPGNYPFSVEVKEVGGTFKTTLSAQYTLTPSLSCVKHDPSLSLTPSTQTANPGELKSYHVTILNNDSSSCTPRNFFKHGSASNGDYGWTSSFPEGPSLSVAPRSTATYMMNVTSPTSAVPGTSHPVTGLVTDTVLHKGYQLPSASYVVKSTVSINQSCTAPDSSSITVNDPWMQAGKASPAPADTRSYSVTYKNPSSNKCSWTLTMQGVTQSTGWTVSPSQIEIAPGASGVFTFSVTPPSIAADGIYSVTGTVTDRAGDSYPFTVLYTVIALSGTGGSGGRSPQPIPPQ